MGALNISCPGICCRTIIDDGKTRLPAFRMETRTIDPLKAGRDAISDISKMEQNVRNVTRSGVRSGALIDLNVCALASVRVSPCN